ncbi:tektin-like protein 1 [Babylonia areolata]|uniref:tektin-like protein 1 n=1 Tax=Babylonia areolata TaxID=304850 RepID=UPI003FD106F9
MTMNFAASTIGPENWRNDSLRTIKLAQTVVKKSDKSNDIGRALDPVPHIRDIVASLSNEQARRYFRDVRVVVSKLRESLLDTNEEIKSLTRGKEALEKALEHIRKDLKVNKDSQAIRTLRPNREKEHDGADDLLDAERAHLFNSKKLLEAQLKLVQEQLQTLERARRRIFAVLQERNRVVDLLCHANSSITNSTNPDKSRLDGRITTIDSRRLTTEDRDALGPYTPETDDALQDGAEARSRSAYLRKGLRDTIDRVEKLLRAAHKSVNDGLTKKVAETETLKQHLDITHGENRHAINRAKRWFEETDRARGYTLGPMMNADLFTRERLERPIMKVFQRHPGNQMPDAQEIIKSGDGLLQSLTATSRNIGLMCLTQYKLADDIRSKSAGSAIDASVIRMRRKKANHRWPIGNPNDF